MVMCTCLKLDSDEKLLLVENRNHVWRDLSRLVDIECKQLTCNSKSFSGKIK